jgi:hypothetical protein
MNMNEVFAIVVDDHDTEIARHLLEPDKAVVIQDKMTELYFIHDIYSFFTPIRLKNLTEDMLQSSVFRDHVFNLTDRCALDFRSIGVDVSVIIDNIVESVCHRADPKASKSLLVMEINETLYINKSVLRDLLSDNIWLMVLYILIVKYAYTETHKTSIGASINVRK